MTDKIDFQDFGNKNVVSNLRRSLYLDNSQFTGLPSSDDIELKACRVKKMTADDSNNLENVKAYEFDAIDTAGLNALLGMVHVTGQKLEKVKKAFEDSSKLTFKVDIQGGNAKNAKDLFNFVTMHSLDTNPNGRVLSGLKWHVEWVYLDQYHDILMLSVDSLADVKIK